MYRFSRIAFPACAVFCAALILICAGIAARGQDAGKEPIAFIGHGAMFDQNGTEVAPTAAFIRGAQAWYRNYLAEKLTKAQRTEFDKLESRLTQGLALDEQSQLVLNASLIDWLLKTAKPQDGEGIQGKNNLMKRYLKTKLPENPDIKLPRSLEPFQFNPELDKRLTKESKASPKSPGFLALTTGTSGQAYRNLCAANGVPIPPNFGSSSWVSRGQIPQTDLFIVAGLKPRYLPIRAHRLSVCASRCRASIRQIPFSSTV
jgi:hypothetical protein